MHRLLHRVPIAISGKAGENVVKMVFADGAVATWYHNQDCCESVTIVDVVGDWADLIGVPLLLAEGRINPPDAPGDEDSWGSTTWTFYTFRSIRGSVDVRWCGESNGYYSESVNFEFSDPQTFSELAEQVARTRLAIICKEAK